MSRPARIVKVYGRDNVLFALVNPLLTLLATSRSLQTPLAGEARILERAERDGQRLANEGYRVVSSDWCLVPLFGVGYLRVVYEIAPRS